MKILIYNSGGGIGDSIQLIPLLNSLKEMLPDVEFCQHGPSTDFAFVEQVDDVFEDSCKR